MKLLFLLLSFSFTLSSIIQAFLQNTGLSSLGTIADGLETFSDDFSQFSYNIDNMISEIEEEIKSLSIVNEDVAMSLIDLNINKLNYQITAIDLKITKIQFEIDDNDECSIANFCSDCTQNSKCVWCTDTLLCTKGDDDGPISGSCDSYSYNKCEMTACDAFFTCTTCLSGGCGWCENGKYCFQGTTADSGDCDSPFYYISGADGRDACPAHNNEDSDSETIVKHYKPDGDKTKLMKEIEELKSKKEEIQDFIEKLKLQKESIEQELKFANSLDANSVAFNSSIDSLAEQVEMLYDEEEASKKNYENMLANQTKTSIVNSVTAQSNNDTSEITKTVKTNSDKLSSHIRDIDSNADSEFAYYDKLIAEINTNLAVTEQDPVKQKEMMDKNAGTTKNN